MFLNKINLVFPKQSNVVFTIFTNISFEMLYDISSNYLKIGPFNVSNVWKYTE